jgi:hypothetical protein
MVMSIRSRGTVIDGPLLRRCNIPKDIRHFNRRENIPEDRGLRPYMVSLYGDPNQEIIDEAMAPQQ